MESELNQKISVVFSNLNLPLKKQRNGIRFIKNIIENYKGTITFETEYGKGTRFSVTPIINSKY
jgi:sensor histidine kinase regulating citrate/malate metabolism